MSICSDAGPYIFLGGFTIFWLAFAGLAWVLVIRHERTTTEDDGATPERGEDDTL